MPLPTPIQASTRGLDCFPLAESESKMVFTDHAGRAFLYDSDENRFIGMPSLHAPKGIFPISVSIAAQGEEESKLYIMDSTLRPEAPAAESTSSFQFEVFDHRKPTPDSWNKFWHCDPLPPPPFVFNSGGGNSIFGRPVSRSHAGDWMLPFSGKAENVPELKLWFAISAKNQGLPCAADLSPVVRGEPPAPGYI
ncbi:hypothetical protein E2562_003291 [Oryza meyeriana var. granulata]|uniref:Uncharacterized protein n=1 Tax=Oryza meyeriana var. granulata TaxID=110450 RepID=A0A6G1EEF2_9ORYZ|nr:hypothetical protein E2562_003291 [Oryza meyeriana var. granulata]